jgi:hypothetical protein
VIAIVSVLIIVALSLVITRVATVALTLTGLSRETARFQARSALTGSGFTTSESEKIVRHPLRRRIVMALMLVGSAGVVSVIGSLMLSFIGSEGAADAGSRVLTLLLGLAGLFWLSTSRWFDRGLQGFIRWLLRRYTDLDVRDYASLLHVHGEYSVSELHVDAGDWLAGRTLQELALTEEGVLVLGIERSDGSYEGAPHGPTLVHAGDIVVLYGPAERLEDLDRRPAGQLGERAHHERTGEPETG